MIILLGDQVQQGSLFNLKIFRSEVILPEQEVFREGLAISWSSSSEKLLL